MINRMKRGFGTYEILTVFVMLLIIVVVLLAGVFKTDYTEKYDVMENNARMFSLTVANLYLPILIPLGIGLLLGSIIVMKLTKKLLEKYYAKTFYSIIGFTIGSIFVLLPQGMTLLEIVLSVLCVVLGVYVSRIPDAIKNFRSSKMFKAVKVLNKMRSQSKTQKD